VSVGVAGSESAMMVGVMEVFGDFGGFDLRGSGALRR
jgi:hypothetical protein